ncbi:hypothetical protein FYJ33_06085 [Clostridiaceae bacterium WCA-383-APC-5B]|uniref:Uncharacterized protein n=1 Tax=Inconstantimicrobium porci TaxID=2652291 RepID=A0A7X2MXQ6_9CLOT|nr:hypothetical protein [Inconstantimicrobium porci]
MGFFVCHIDNLEKLHWKISLI